MQEPIWTRTCAWWVDVFQFSMASMASLRALYKLWRPSTMLPTALQYTRHGHIEGNQWYAQLRTMRTHLPHHAAKQRMEQIHDRAFRVVLLKHSIILQTNRSWLGWQSCEDGSASRVVWFAGLIHLRPLFTRTGPTHLQITCVSHLQITCVSHTIVKEHLTLSLTASQLNTSMHHCD